MPGSKRLIVRGLLILLLVAVAVAVWFYGPLFWGLYKHGVFDRPSAAHDYQGTSVDNLRAMRTALLGYEESEGQFPVAAGWMDAIQNRLNTDDLKKGQSTLKLIYPEYRGQEGKYGYALNDAFSGKYHGDIKDPKAPMVFESTSTERNAHGDPARMLRPGGQFITADGQVLH